MTFHYRNLRLTLLLILICFFYGKLALAQWTAVPFLLISPSARTTAMGESGVALADDASSAFLNPAGLGFQKGQEVNLTYTGWVPQFPITSSFKYDYLFYGQGNYRMNFDEIGGTIAAAFTYFSVGDMCYYNSSNDLAKGTSIYDYAISVSYGAPLTNDLSFGLGIRFIHSEVFPEGTEAEVGSGKASVISEDIGILYRPSRIIIPFTEIDLGKRVGIGLSLINIGPSMSYIEEALGDPLPTNLRLGIALDFIQSEYHRITWSFDVNKLIISRSGIKADPFFTAFTKTWTTFYNGRKKNISDIMREVNFGTGVEYWYSNMIALRVGYFYEDPDMGDRRMFTFGAGVRYNIFGLDLSYIALYGKYTARTPANETLRLTASVNWDNEKLSDDNLGH